MVHVPSDDVSSLLQQAAALRARGRLDRAEALARSALKRAPADPAAHYMLATVLLTRGDYAGGLPHFETRHRVFNRLMPKLPYPAWRGEPVRQLLVWPEQGYGDQIQMARFAARLAENAKVSWVTPTPLARLFSECLPVEVIEVAQSITFPDPDAWVMSFGLPLCLGVRTPADLPSEPYLRAPAAARTRWASYAKGEFKIGVAWRGNPDHRNDAHRSLPARAALEPLGAYGAVHDLTDPVGDFADTAAVVEQLDLVITVDTALAHLAGAMGKACWVLLPAIEVDWRWMTGRTDSPWYPSIRLFRQTTPGDWAPVIQQVTSALARLPRG